MDTRQALIKEGGTTVATALHIYDQLETVELDFMLGRWKGSELRTNHPFDGLLELSGWYGKLFIDPENVHPLLFYGRNHQDLYAVNPSLIPLGFTALKSKSLCYMMLLCRPLLQTTKAAARLRMIKYRGKVSAAMLYDTKPIYDVFRKIDENSVLGVMDLKGMSQPYFFLLKRDNTAVKLKL